MLRLTKNYNFLLLVNVNIFENKNYIFKKNNVL